MLFKLHANGKEKLFSYSHDIYEYIKKEVLLKKENLDLLHDIQWFCAFSMKGDSYGGDNGFIIENISEWNRNFKTETERLKMVDNMTVKDLIRQLMDFEENSEVIIYDDDNDRVLEIACVDADEGDESDESPQVMIIV